MTLVNITDRSHFLCSDVVLEADIILKRALTVTTILGIIKIQQDVLTMKHTVRLYTQEYILIILKTVLIPVQVRNIFFP